MGALARKANDSRRGSSLPILAVQITILLSVVLLWEIIAATGIFYHGVFPSITTIAAAFFRMVTTPVFYWHLSVTIGEVALALLFGGLAGAAVGFLFGIVPFFSKSFENYVYYVSSTPKIIFFPIVITWFGVDSGSKIGLGAIAAFFPVCLNIAGGIRGVNPIWIKAARSYQSTAWQLLWKVYLPAIRGALLNAIRLGLAVTIISVLLAETKLARNGLGFMVDQAYGRYDMPTMYALILFIFATSVLINSVLSRWGAQGPRGTFT